MENRSMIKMVYAAVMASLAQNSTIKGSTGGANEYRTRNYLGSQKKRTSKSKKKFHRQLKRR